MKKILIATATAFATLLTVETACAQATRTWVSGGAADDSSACTRAAPCKTISGALGKTAVNGEINCINPIEDTFVQITKSVTIDCTGALGALASSTLNGITIPFDLFASGDARKTVVIRGISIDELNAGPTPIQITGEGSNSYVFIEDVVLNGSYGGNQIGVGDTRTNGNLMISNTTIRNMGSAGVYIHPNNGTGVIRATLNGVTVANAGSGLTSSAGAAMAISNSVFTQNSVVGVQVGPGAQALIEDSKISHNGTGLSAAGIIRLSESNVFLNTSAAVSGTVQSYTDNNFIGTIGGTITPIGSVSNPTGLQ